ncbi:MAG: rRNA maturation RNase YbeY [Flavobacteriaceae bacterium]
MIEFHYELDFELPDENLFSNWVYDMVSSEKASIKQIVYIFCDDRFLLNLNQKYLEHDEYTDIVTFDYSQADDIAGDIFISVDRLRENALLYNVYFEEELKRVMAHGVLHLMGYNDKSPEEIAEMRWKEAEKMKLFHVEQ